MESGLKHTSTTIVDSTNIASTVGSGDLEVFATPAMIALMENAAARAVAPELTEGSTTVGTSINVTHNRATPFGAKVTATAILREAEGRRLVFEVTSSDDKGIIGEGTHERFIVDAARFMEKIAK